MKDAQHLQAIDDTTDKPHSAYNQFVRQEKEYILGMQLANEHVGDRWADMNPNERELYQILQDTHD